MAHLQLATRGTSRNALLRLVRQAVVPGSEATTHACGSWESMISVRHDVAEVAVRLSKGGIVPGVLPPVPYQAESSASGTM